MNDTEWIAMIADQMGRKTINEARADLGLSPVKGGEIAYIDYLKKMLGLPLRPNITLVLPQLEIEP